MDDAELVELVNLLRAARTDIADVEVKAAGGGLPRSVRETVSAFSNGDGGTLILGLDERAGFTLSAGFDAQRIQAALAAACADEMEPPVRASISIVMFEGHPVVIGEVPELEPRFKPSYVKARGEYGGSFIRGGDGDRRLTDVEIHLLHTNRGQPRDDLAPVPGAGIRDLKGVELEALLRRVRRRQPRALAGLDDVAALQRLNVVTDDDPPVPTLAGLLALGEYPQHFFPQLNVTFVAYPGLGPSDQPAGMPRFLDNVSLDGPIPDMVADVIPVLMRNMATRAYVEAAGRRDVLEYPLVALREGLVNALVHRDYSHYSQSSPVQVMMFADRLTIANPGGLFGAVTADDLGREGVVSTRNPVLIKILQDTREPDSDRMVCENRGSGVPTMLRETRELDARPPEFRSRIARFTVTFRKPPSPMASPAQEPAPAVASDDPVLNAIPSGDSVSRQEIEDITHLSQAGVLRRLKRLVEDGLVVAIGPARSPRRRYRRAGPTRPAVG